MHRAAGLSVFISKVYYAISKTFHDDADVNVKFNPNLETVISNYKPLIFWKEKEIVKQQLRIWSEKNLRRLINEINNTELLIKKNISVSLNILLNFIFINSKIINN